MGYRSHTHRYDADDVYRGQCDEKGVPRVLVVRRWARDEQRYVNTIFEEESVETPHRASSSTGNPYVDNYRRCW